jgi:hypothetical protein
MYYGECNFLTTQTFWMYFISSVGTVNNFFLSRLLPPTPTSDSDRMNITGFLQVDFVLCDMMLASRQN